MHTRPGDPLPPANPPRAGSPAPLAIAPSAPRPRHRARPRRPRPRPHLRFALLAALALTLVPACGGSSVAEDQPWFCGPQGADRDETARLMLRRGDARSVAAANRVLQTDDWRECWGNAAILLGTLGAAADPAAILARADALAEEPTDGRPLLEIDAILNGYALTARQSTDSARIDGVVAALLTRSDPAWWIARDAADYPHRDDKPRLAALRARSALIALSWTGTRAAERALTTLRDDPTTLRRVGDDGRALLSDLIRENRACMDQPPGQRR
ncbi:MAG: hypothetical protein H6705_14515 [Myxococcales bacterium]|nr:hypothetical protein [Myxococcales bacterium]